MIENVSADLLKCKDKLFKSTAYDIRAYVGEVGDFFSEKAVLTPERMRIAGILMGSMVFTNERGKKYQLNVGDKVVVGYDNGPTSKELANAFSKGIMEQGVDVYDIGIASSGQVYHNQVQLNAQGHVQITRSHVEVTTNGAKFGIGEQGIHTYLLKQMNEILSKGHIGRDAPAGKMHDKVAEGRKLYCDKMIARYGGYFKEHPRKVAVNLFGGTGLQYKELFLKVFGEDNVIILGDSINVNDGGLLADPTRKEMLEKVPMLGNVLAQNIRVHSFDLDADRGSVTEGRDALTSASGHYLGDDIAYILADYKLTLVVPKLFSALADLNLPREKADKIHKIVTTVIVDPRFTSGVKAFAEKKGGSIIYHRKGHSLWKETMTSNLTDISALAGFTNPLEFVKRTKYQDTQIEASLHLFLSDPDDCFMRDDAVENVFLLEKMLDELQIPSLTAYFKRMPKRYATKEIRTNSSSNEAKEAITYDIVDKIRKNFSKYDLIEFEGQIRAEWPSGFIMYGMSNTSPKLTMMAEGSTVEERNEALAYILALHNEAKKRHNDPLPMDLSENSFFIKDYDYNMQQPDNVDFSDARAADFCKKHGIELNK